MSQIRSREQLAARIADEGLAIIPFVDFHAMFPGRQLHEAEREFRTAMFEACGQTHLEHGSSQEDQLLAFLSERHVNLQMLKRHYLFYRCRIDLESLMNSEL